MVALKTPSNLTKSYFRTTLSQLRYICKIMYSYSVYTPDCETAFLAVIGRGKCHRSGMWLLFILGSEDKLLC